jgi:amino acid transporter
MVVVAMTAPGGDRELAFEVERYKYLLQQLHTTNENVYRFLAIYQTLATVLVGAALALFVRYEDWHIDPAIAQLGILALLALVTVIAAFTVLLIVVGVLNWLDYRREECELTDIAVRPGFRRPPEPRNLWRWYETYIVLFIVASIGFMWLGAGILLLPAMP